MTIRQRIYFSNVRMAFISLGAFTLSVRIVMFLMYGSGRPSREILSQLRESHSQDMNLARGILIMVLFVILVNLINSYLTYRMIKHIVKPLEPLNEGVRQIHENNLAYRIDYKDDDEFRLVCGAFDEMAAKLEASLNEKEKNDRNRRELIAGIFHDLSTPLTSIKGCIEVIETGTTPIPIMQKKYLDIMKDKAEVMEHIIDQLFLFSKVDLEEFLFTMRSVDITSAISEMIEESFHEYTSRGLDIKFTEKHDDVFALVDVFMLRNVVDNILDNSLKYKTKNRGQMEISISVVNGFVLLSFTDDGSGVDEDMLPKLFEVFYRADPSRSKKGSGL